MVPRYPQRIVCLTEETTELLYLLGEQERIVGISGFTVRPPQARKEKPKVSAFTSAKIDRILALEPDLVLGFSDLQADIASSLIRSGVAVYISNQRSVQAILDMMLIVGSMVDAKKRVSALLDQWASRIEAMRRRCSANERRPVVYFEEWDEPRISGIRWVSELIEIAGGVDCFPERALKPLAKDRIIEKDEEIIRRQPDIIIGSWCGKKFRPERVRAREGWERTPAVRLDHLYEIKSCDILQPGPAALTDGLTQLEVIVNRWRVGK